MQFKEVTTGREKSSNLVTSMAVTVFSVHSGEGLLLLDSCGFREEDAPDLGKLPGSIGSSLDHYNKAYIAKQPQMYSPITYF